MALITFGMAMMFVVVATKGRIYTGVEYAGYAAVMIGGGFIALLGMQADHAKGQLQNVVPNLYGIAWLIAGIQMFYF